jgi:hypothetical protein
MKLTSYLGKFPLLGFKSECDIITLDQSHIIKRGTKKELQVTSQRIETSNHKLFDYFLNYSFDSERDDNYPEEIIDHLMLLNIFFKIFKKDSIGIPYCHRFYKHEENEFISIGFITDPRVNYSEGEYFISRKEVIQLKNLWSKFLISIQNGFFLTAVRRYYYSSQRFDNEDKIIDLMISFEALLLKENSGLSYLLSSRVSRLLDDCELVDFMKSCYKIRSKIVHGDLKPIRDIERMNDIETKRKIMSLDEILRLSMRKYVENFSYASKSEFIGIIDNITI